MMEALQILLFTAVAVALYMLSDRILTRIEAARGAPLPYREVIYFLVILVLALGAFRLIETVVGQ